MNVSLYIYIYYIYKRHIFFTKILDTSYQSKQVCLEIGSKILIWFVRHK
jgi:hypothetical protein